MKKDLEHGVFLGVCSGLANYSGIDVSILRLLFVLATILGVGTPILAYIILAIVMQKPE